MEKSWSRQQMDEAFKFKAPRRDLEHSEQAAFFQLLALNESRYPALAWVHAVPNGGHRAKATAAKLKAEGVKPGISDIFVPIPANGMNGMYIEFKAGKNTLSAKQKEFRDFAIEHGYHFKAAWSAEEAIKELSIYLGIVLRTVR